MTMQDTAARFQLRIPALEHRGPAVLEVDSPDTFTAPAHEIDATEFRALKKAGKS